MQEGQTEAERDRDDQGGVIVRERAIAQLGPDGCTYQPHGCGQAEDVDLLHEQHPYACSEQREAAQGEEQRGEVEPGSQRGMWGQRYVSTVVVDVGMDELV